MRYSVTLVLAVSLASLTGCGDKLQALHKEGMELQKELCEILEGVRTKNDALNVKDRVDTIVKKLGDLTLQARKRVSDKEAEEAKRDLDELTKKDLDDILALEDRLKKARAALPADAAQVLNDVLP